MLFLLFWFLSLTHAIPLDLTLDLNTFRNLTTTDRCANSPEWQAYAFLVEDCFTAIQRVYIEKVLKEPDETHEFISRGNYPRTEYPWLRTPAQYTVNSCTLSIVMLDWFRPPWSLPGGGVEGSEPSDTTTFRTIWSAARIIERDCLLRTRRPGWGAIGKKSSIGVFLWATDSAINEQVLARGDGADGLVLSNTSISIDSTE